MMIHRILKEIGDRVDNYELEIDALRIQKDQLIRHVKDLKSEVKKLRRKLSRK